MARFGRRAAVAMGGVQLLADIAEADAAAEAAIYRVLETASSSLGFISEESGGRAGERPETWIVNPLDGTGNCASSIPYFATSIALCDAEGEILGVVFDPIHNEMFSAKRGEGAWLNDLPLPLLTPKAPEGAFLSISVAMPQHRRCVSEPQFLIGLHMAMKTAAALRRLGSTALDLAYVGCGRLDGYFEDGLSYYDLAAGKLFAQGAGATVTGLDGAIAREGLVIAGQSAIHGCLSKTFKGHSPQYGFQIH